MAKVTDDDAAAVVPPEMFGPPSEPTDEWRFERSELAERIMWSPATVLIRQHVRNAATLGLDVTDPTVLARCIEAGEAEHAGAAPPSTSTFAPIWRDRKRVKSGSYPSVFVFGSAIAHVAVVYYMQSGNRIKIGTTTNLKGRLGALVPERLAAIEPGGRDIERLRHDQFAPLRIRSEWFRESPDLLAHIADVGRRFEEIAGVTLVRWMGGY